MTFGGTATSGGVDYSTSALPVTFNPGQATALLSVSTVNDSASEPTETDRVPAVP